MKSLCLYTPFATKQINYIYLFKFNSWHLQEEAILKFTFLMIYRNNIMKQMIIALQYSNLDAHFSFDRLTIKEIEAF